MLSEMRQLSSENIGVTIMRCPYCGQVKDKVLDSRERRDGTVIRRRRACLSCQKRFTTYEQIEGLSIMVVKKDNRREPFDRNKILGGLIKSCNKRPISMQILEQFVDETEQELSDRPGRELSSKEIGERIMKMLYDLDEVAYVRFASVYRQFKDINQFMDELKRLLEQKPEPDQQT